MFFGTNNSTRMTIDASGNVGIGTSSPAYKLDVNGSSAAKQFILEHQLNQTCRGAIYYGTPLTITDVVTPTDHNYATYICAYSDSANSKIVLAASTGIFLDCSTTVTGSFTSTGDQVVSSDATLKTNLQDVTYSVEDIAKTRAVTFDWKDGRGKSAGSIAQDWKPLIPELVHGEEGSMTLAYGQIALVNTIIEAREIEVLKKRVAELEDEVKRLRS